LNDFAKLISHQIHIFNKSPNIISANICSYTVHQEGEAWYEVAGELAQEGTRPITPDQECLQEILQITERKAEEVLKKQVKNNTLSLMITFCLSITTA